MFDMHIGVTCMFNMYIGVTCMFNMHIGPIRMFDGYLEFFYIINRAYYTKLGGLLE